MSVKQERVAQIILKDVTDIIQFSLKDPSVGFVTITDVQVTNDYSYATIYVFLRQGRTQASRSEGTQPGKGFYPLGAGQTAFDPQGSGFDFQARRFAGKRRADRLDYFANQSQSLTGNPV